MMGRGCWRLLAAFSLIFVASALARGQDATADRVPILRPNAQVLRYPLPVRPILPVGGRQVGNQAGNPVGPSPNLLQQMVRAAGIIFSGRVTAIGYTGSGGRDPASNAITFQVEHAVRGTSAGQVLTIQEWAGLWNGGERYRVGERVLLFLYSPSKLGLTSPVAGAMGRFAVDPQGMIVMSLQHIANFAGDPTLIGKTIVPYDDFARAVELARPEE